MWMLLSTVYLPLSQCETKPYAMRDMPRHVDCKDCEFMIEAVLDLDMEMFTFKTYGRHK